MTIEKVKSIAKEKYGKDLTDAQAAAYIEKYGKLSDGELDGVVGGGCGSSARNCPECNTKMEVSVQAGIWTCSACGYIERAASV